MFIKTGASPSQLQESRMKIAEFHKKHVDQKNRNHSNKESNVAHLPTQQTLLMGTTASQELLDSEFDPHAAVTSSLKNTAENSAAVQSSRAGGGSVTYTPSTSPRGTDAPSVYPNLQGFLAPSPSHAAITTSSDGFNWKQHPHNAAEICITPSQKYSQNLATASGMSSHKFGTTPPVAGSNYQPQSEKQLSESLASSHLWTETSSGYASDAFAEDDGSTSQMSDGSRDRNDQGGATEQTAACAQGRRTWTTPGPGSAEGKGILSQKGTIRGVHNKVRTALIAFNYDPDIETKVKTRGEAAKNGSANFSDEEGRVVLYTTSSGIIPEVSNRCGLVRNILMFHRVKFEERDLFLSKENVKELEMRMRLCKNAGVSSSSSSSSITSFGGGAGAFSSPVSVNGNNQLDVPQVFVDGVWLGNAKKIEELNETGELKKTFKRFEKINAETNICAECWGYTYVMCKQCNGSKKSTSVRNGFTDKFIALKCTHCDPNGLQRCPVACYMK